MFHTSSRTVFNGIDVFACVVDDLTSLSVDQVPTPHVVPVFSVETCHFSSHILGGFPARIYLYCQSQEAQIQIT